MFQQAVPILAKGRRVPHRLIHAQPDEPPEEQVVTDLLDQQTLAAHRIEQLDQLGTQEALRSDARPAVGSIHAVQVRADRLQGAIRQHQHPAQRVIDRDTRLHIHVAENRALTFIDTAHGKTSCTKTRHIDFPEPLFPHPARATP